MPAKNQHLSSKENYGVGILIPYYKFNEIHAEIADQLSAVAKQVIDSGNYVFGTQQFEEEFANWTGSRYCIAVSNGTSALHLALLALGVRPGDEVITVAHTFRATVAAIHYVGATPKFIDIDPETYCMDATQLEQAITSRTRAIIPVHIYGNAADMPVICNIAQRHGIPVVEDCSQAHGTRINSQHVGTFGQIGTFSFYPGKGLGALGDAGCVVTNDQGLADYIRQSRQWSDHEVGYNYRMSNIQAEFLRVKLKDFDRVLKIKQEIAGYYDQHFNYATHKSNVEHSYHVYPVLVKDRAQFQRQVGSAMEVKSHYPVPVHRLAYYRSSYDLPVTEHVSAHEVSLPIYPGVDYQQVIEILNANSSCLL